jgi:hypothetical protein
MNDDQTRIWNRRNTIMTLANLASQAASHAPSAHELLNRIGLERRRSRTRRAAARAGWIGVGMAVGSGLALFFAPRNGQAMREALGEQAKRARDYVTPPDAAPSDAPEEGDAEARRRTSPSGGRTPRRL